MTCQRGRNFKGGLFFSFTTNTLEQDAGEELHLVDMHFKRDLLCKFEGVRETRTGEELRNKVLEGANRRHEGGRDHYLSAPGREAATFGRGGGAVGFKLNYRTKTKIGQGHRMTAMNMGVFNVNMDKKNRQHN